MEEPEEMEDVYGQGMRSEKMAQGIIEMLCAMERETAVNEQKEQGDD